VAFALALKTLVSNPPMQCSWSDAHHCHSVTRPSVRLSVTSRLVQVSRDFDEKSCLVVAVSKSGNSRDFETKDGRAGRKWNL